MPEESCPNYWREYGCEWNIQYLWHWTNWYARLDIVVLALLLALIFVVAIHVSLRLYVARRGGRTRKSSRSPGGLAFDLSIEVGSLRSIARIAPYLGLFGTCAGLMGMFGAFAMEKHAVQAMLASKAAAALLTTAAGILVAVPATCLYNYLFTRIDSLQCEMSNEPFAQMSRGYQGTGRLPLTRRFSGPPMFALMAASSLAILVAACTPFSPNKAPTGFSTELASTRCDYVQNDRVVILHVTNAGKLLINDEEEDWKNLAGRLSEIYRVRERRGLDLLVDEEVSFQTAANVLDIVAGATSTTTAERLKIEVRLITPATIKAGCIAVPSRFIPI